MADIKYNISNLKELDGLISQFPDNWKLLEMAKNKLRSTSKGMGRGKKIINKHKLQTEETEKLYQVYNKPPENPFTKWLMNIILVFQD